MAKSVGRLICAGGVFATGALFFLQTLMIEEPMGRYVLGPRAMPGALAVLLMALGAIFAAQQIFPRFREAGSEKSKQEKINKTEFFMAVAVIFYLISMWLVGYNIANFLFSASVFYFFGKLSPLSSVLWGGVFVGIFYFIFGFVLSAELMTGIVW